MIKKAKMMKKPNMAKDKPMMYGNKPNFLKAKVTKTDKGYTKRLGSSENLGRSLKGSKARKSAGEAAKSYAAQAGAQFGAYALGASGLGGAAIGIGAAAARTAGNKIQQAVAKRRVKKYGQKGSAIVPNAPGEYKGQNTEKAFLGEKTRTHKDAAAGRKSARNYRKAFRAADKAEKFDRRYAGKPMAKFPDLSGDGKVTKKDILMGRGVIDKPKMLKNKRKDIAGKAMMSYAKPNMAMKKKPAMAKDKPMMSKKKPMMAKDKPMMAKKPKKYVSDAQRKAVHASKEDGGKGNPNKPKKIKKGVSGPKGTGKHHTMTRVNTKKRKATVKEVSKKKAGRISKRNEKKRTKQLDKITKMNNQYKIDEKYLN